MDNSKKLIGKFQMIWDRVKTIGEGCPLSIQIKTHKHIYENIEQLITTTTTTNKADSGHHYWPVTKSERRKEEFPKCKWLEIFIKAVANIKKVLLNIQLQ